jgi:hypothetical protein
MAASSPQMIDHQNAYGSAAAIALSGFATWLVPTPPDAKPLFVIIAIGSGAIGYWISRASGFKGMGIPGRITTGIIVVVLLVLLSYGYLVYYHLLSPTAPQDILGFLAFGAAFATLCFGLGLLQIEVFRVGPGPSLHDAKN